MKLAIFILAFVAAGWQVAESFSGGASSQACDDLMPSATSHAPQSQTTSVPYSIDLSPLNDAASGQMAYTPGQTYTCKSLSLRSKT